MFVVLPKFGSFNGLPCSELGQHNADYVDNKDKIDLATIHCESNRKTAIMLFLHNFASVGRFLADRCIFIAMSGYCHDMPSVVCLCRECIVTKWLKLGLCSFHQKCSPMFYLVACQVR